MSATEPKPVRDLVVSAETGLDTGERVRITKGLKDTGDRFRALFDLMIADHGFVRTFWPNIAEVAPGVFRSSQPSPRQFERWRRLGIKTVFNLRAERNCGSFLLEEEACARLGLELINLQTRSRDVPSKDLIATADRLFETAAYPILLHCKSGADRAGIMSALYLLLRTDATVEEAQAALGLRYGHVRQAKTGMLDFFLAEFAEAHALTGIGFRDWVDTVYDPADMKARFMERWNGTLGLDLAFWRE